MLLLLLQPELQSMRNWALRRLPLSPEMPVSLLSTGCAVLHTEAFKKSRHFDPPANISDLARMASPIVSMGNQTGEGWFLTGEMMELIHGGTQNIVCTQPFGCLPNHIVGKGVIKEIRRSHPEANIVAIDYDPGAS